jgi:Protein of unknown function (DUF1549)/Protein of unknown function (DUF1553)
MLGARSATALLVVALSPLSALQAQDSDAALLPAAQPIEAAIDHYIDAGLREAGVVPAPRADDPTWLRRVTLDLVGRIPTVAETEQFLHDNDPQKAIKAVDRLLASGGFVRHQGQEFATMLQVEDGRRPTRNALQDYLEAAFADHRGWDRIFREILLPDDNDPKQRGAGEFLKARVKETDRLTIDVSTLFLGVNVSCAQCHDHPHVPAWTQDHFYGLKSFFARTVDVGGLVVEKDFGSVKYVPNKKKEKLAPVMFLTGKVVDVPGIKEPSKDEKKHEQDRLESAKKNKKAPAPPHFSLRAKFVETALQPGENVFFSRAIVNRLFYRFMGQGMVMPLDQMHVENPPSHPALLQWLSRDLVAHQYDLRRLMRGIVLSNAYARTSVWAGETPPEANLFAVAQIRPLAPMQLALSLEVATSTQKPLADLKTQDNRLLDLSKNAARWAPLFPPLRPGFQVGVGEALLFANNGQLLKELLSGPFSLVTSMRAEPDLARRAEMAIETTLSRPATASEIHAAVEYLQRREDRPEEGCQQVVWALLTSAEFRFNH